MALGAGCDLNCGCTYLRIFQAYKKGNGKRRADYPGGRTFNDNPDHAGENLTRENEYNKIPYDAVECREHLDTAEEAAGKRVCTPKKYRNSAAE